MLKTKVQLFLLATTVVLTAAIDQNVINNEFIELQGISRAILGSGVNPNDLPIAKCDYVLDQSENTTCQIVIRDGSRCNITYSEDTLTNAKSVYQFPGNKVLLHLSRYFNNQQDAGHKYTLTLVDMSNCTRVYDVSLPIEAEQVIPYEDGSYDVVQTVRRKKCCMEYLRVNQYDANGQSLGESIDISLDLEEKHVDAVSTKSRSRGFFIRGRPTNFDSPTELKLLANVGKLQFKDMLDLNSRYGLISHIDTQKYYAICGKNMQTEGKLVCKRLDLKTEQIFEAEFELGERSGARHVRTSQFGIVVFGVQLDEEYQVEKFVVVEMRPGEKPIVQKIDFPWNATVVDNCQIRDFDGASRNFSLAFEVTSPKRGVALHKFVLPDSA